MFNCFSAFNKVYKINAKNDDVWLHKKRHFQGKYTGRLEQQQMHVEGPIHWFFIKISYNIAPSLPNRLRMCETKYERKTRTLWQHACTHTHIHTHIKYFAGIMRRLFILMFIYSRHKLILGRYSQESVLQSTDANSLLLNR
jgi:hypothetical protein